MRHGKSLRRQDYTAAATRAIKDATRHSAIPLFDATGLPYDQMRVQVTIGVQAPEQVDCNALVAKLRRGRAAVRAVFGGRDVTNPGTGAVLVIASAAVEAFFSEASELLLTERCQQGGARTGTSQPE